MKGMGADAKTVKVKVLRGELSKISRLSTENKESEICISLVGLSIG